MAVTLPWFGAAALVLAAVAAGLALLLPSRLLRRQEPPGLLIAHSGRIRELPRFRALVRRHLRLVVLECLCLTVAVAGGALLAARVIGTQPTAEEKKLRDVVLCLDVSGSMTAIDQQLIDVYRDLSADLVGERIGLVMFDSSPVTVFPLTDDPDFIADQLAAARDRLATGPIPGTDLGRGSSLIGDGLASCLQRFDHRDERRSRTVVLATDNQLAGDPLFTLESATDLAVTDEVMVFGITPAGNEPAAVTALQAQTARTDGGLMTLTPGGATDTTAVERAIRAQERIALAARDRRFARDVTWPGALLVLVGVAGAATTRIVRSRP